MRPGGPAGPTDATRAQRARVAVAVLFVVNGALSTAWLPRLVEVQQGIGLDDAALGLALSMGALGGLAVGPIAGPLVGRFGSARISVLSLLAYAPVVFLPAAVGSGWALAASLVWITGCDGVMDAAMNAHGIRVQSHYGRSIINSFHGFWSLGAVTGSLLGTLSLTLGLPLVAFLAAVGVACAVAVLAVVRWLLPAPDPHSHLEPADDDPDGGSGARGRGPGRRAVALALVGLGLFTVLAVIVEDVPARWSSVYLTAVGAVGGLVGAGVVAFTASQTLGRFLGDRLVDRFGEVTVVRASMAVVAVVLAGGLVLGTTGAYVAACAVAGFGVATLFPAAMHAAAHLPGVRPAMGVAVVSWLARLGFLVAPLAVGALAQVVGIAWGIAVAVLAAAVLVPLAGLLAPRSPRLTRGRTRSASDGPRR